MKKLYIIITLFCFPVFSYAEIIRSFDAEVIINTDGSIGVTETIVYDFEDLDRRGIFRTIPKEYDFEDTTRLLDIELVGVSRNGVQEPHTVSNSNKQWEVKIGEKDTFISGAHTYKITYKVEGAIRYFSDVDELYWNITGSKWNVPIESWSANFSFPDNVSLVQIACYEGVTGSNNFCKNKQEQGSTVSYEGFNLGQGKEATVALGVTPGIIEELIIEKKQPEPFWLLGLLGAVIFYVRSLYRQKTKHYEKKSLVTQFDSYDNYSALFSGYYIDGQLHTRDIVAGIIELAQLGYIVITQKGEDTWLKDFQYELVLQDMDYSVLSKPQKKLLILFFGKEYKAGDVYDTESKTLLKRSHMTALQSSVSKRALEYGLSETSAYPWKIAVGAYVVAICSTVLFLGFHFALFPVAMFLAVWTFILPIIVMDRKTTKGYEARRHLQGLHRYIDVAEKDRINFHNAPEKNPETFSKLLPFAVAFGLEKQWAEQFGDMQIEQEWFQSQSGQNLNPAVLASSVSSIGSQVSSRTPSSSSSGSGSGGGGFSGGGSGGGGGGSW